ncbi:hypothetical protein D6851_14655 [Altericroceibacterium spongiae]|uniref:Probable membrane transporter protein n=1 Tax=Altericroceibacterium spongiae TaxID=2320269 RepID=A0A420ECG1_9SPHN|nr:TSUP family transporter [Altericroceibacterium spongiae]RKF18378.1 hypothetical protein D6851_14655 [Altericroceibacterium spongiae]
MEIEPWLFAALTCLAVFTGFVDAVAGGGGLIVMPTLLAAGIPPQNALATNKLQSTFATGMACRTFLKAGMVDWRTYLPSAIMVFIGASAGVLVVSQIDTSALQLIIPILLLGVAAYVIFSPRMDDNHGKPRISAKAYAGPAGGIAFYDGFFGPGAGSFFIASAVGLRGLGLTHATGLSKMLNFTSNIATLIIWGLSGKTYWALGICMGLAAATGSFIGSHSAMRFGSRLIRPALIVISIALTTKLLYDYLTG